MQEVPSHKVRTLCGDVGLVVLVCAAGYVTSSRPTRELLMFSVTAILVARAWSLVFDVLFVEALRTTPQPPDHPRPFYRVVLDYVGFEAPLTLAFAVAALTLLPITYLEALSCAFFLTCFYTLFWFLVEWRD